MKKILVILVFCAISSRCVELENICSSDTFTYDGVLVNAFHRVQSNFTFLSLNDYLINDTIECNKNEFTNKDHFETAMDGKEVYNRQFIELYTKDLKELLDLGGQDLYKKEENLGLNGWGRLEDLVKAGAKEKCVQIFEKVANSGYKPSTEEAIVNLGKLMGKLKASNDLQTFAFKSEIPSYIYKWKRTAIPTEFKFLNDSVQGPKTKRILYYDQYLPFNNKLHTDEGCVPAKRLPLFYKDKGKNPDEPKGAAHKKQSATVTFHCHCSL